MVRGSVPCTICAKLEKNNFIRKIFENIFIHYRLIIAYLFVATDRIKKKTA